MTPEEFGQSYAAWYLQPKVPSFMSTLRKQPTIVRDWWDALDGTTHRALFAETFRQYQAGNPEATQFYNLLLTHRLKS